jgi:hypothetical protein
MIGGDRGQAAFFGLFAITFGGVGIGGPTGEGTPPACRGGGRQG